MRKVRNPEQLCGCGHPRNEHAGLMRTGICLHPNSFGNRMGNECKCPYFKGVRKIPFISDKSLGNYIVNSHTKGKDL